MANRRSSRTPSSSLALRISVFTCRLRAEDAGHLGGTAQQIRQRLVALVERREMRLIPSKVGPSCGASRSMVADSVSSDWLSAAVSVSAVLAVNSPRASVSE